VGLEEARGSGSWRFSTYRINFCLFFWGAVRAWPRARLSDV